MAWLKANDTTSLLSTTGSGIPTNLATTWELGFHYAMDGYPSQFTQLFWWGDGGPSNIVGADSGELTAGSMDIYAVETNVFYGNPIPLTENLNTGPAWVCMGHTAGTHIYEVRIKRPWERKFKRIIIDTVVEVTGLTSNTFKLFNDGFGDNSNTRIRDFWIKDYRLTDQRLLEIANTFGKAPKGRNLTYLPLDDTATATINRGSGADWSLTGTLTSVSGDPRVSRNGLKRIYVFAATRAASAASAASSAPTLTGGATGASLAAAAASSAPTLTGGATSAALAAAAASSAPTLTGAATSSLASEAQSAPTLSAGATGVLLGTGDGSCAPTLSAAGTATSLAAGAPSSAPTLSAAAVGTTADARTVYFRDDFNGSDIDSSIWVKGDRQGDPANSELHCYVPSMVTTSSGNLAITSEIHTQSCGDDSNAPTSHAYRSGQIYQKLASFRYGTIRFKVKMPSATGLWPIVWLLGEAWQESAIAVPGDANPAGASWPNVPWNELDIYELGKAIGGHDLTSGFVNMIIHSGTHQGGEIDIGTDPTASFVDVEFIWTSTSCTWNINGSTVQTITTSIPTNAMFLMVGTAVGGIGGGTPIDAQFPGTLLMDYIEVLSDTGSCDSQPTLSAGAVGQAAFAGAASSAPTLSASAGTASTAISAPTLTAGATGVAAGVTAASSAPTLSANGTSAALKSAAASSQPNINAAATSGSGSGSGEDEWHPDFYHQGWIPQYYSEPS